MRLLCVLRVQLTRGKHTEQSNPFASTADVQYMGGIAWIMNRSGSHYLSTWTVNDDRVSIMDLPALYENYNRQMKILTDWYSNGRAYTSSFNLKKKITFKYANCYFNQQTKYQNSNSVTHRDRSRVIVSNYYHHSLNWR